MIKRITWLLIICCWLFTSQVCATQWLKQSTAVTVKMGPFLDSTNGDTEEISLTISQADIRLSKNGGAYAQTNNATGATHDENGLYGVPLNTTDTATLGRLKVYIHESGALAVWETFMIVPANVWDSLFGADYLQIDAKQLDGSAIQQTSGHIHAFDDAGAALATSGALATVDTNVDDIETDTGTTLDALIKDIPTVAEFELRTQANSGEAMVNWLVFWDDDEYDNWYDLSEHEILSDMQEIEDGDATTYIETRTLASGAYFLFGSDEVITDSASRTASKATTVGLSDNAITAAKVHANAWQELIGLFFTWDASGLGSYGTESNSVVDQIADNAGVATALNTTVGTGDTTTSFTLTAGTPAALAYPDMQITVIDANGNTSTETRRITNYTNGRVITVDSAFSFTPAAGDIVVVERAYLGVSATATIPPRVE